MNEKKIILTARIVSLIFRPFYLPLVGVIALFIFSYLSMFPTALKVIAILLVYILTVLLPTVLIHSYRTYQGWTPWQLGVKERRMVPYVISILCYFTCFYVMNILHMPYFLNSILVAALAIQVLCAITNVWWKISTHTAAIGGVAGALTAFSLIFNFNPVWWLSLVIFIAGMVGTSRMILRQHSLPQVSAGFFLGLMSAFFVIVLL
jgi:membrane-associated phospholipid phosphatase